MLGSCPQCKKPTSARGLTCDSCIGEAHRPRPKRRAKTVSRADSSVNLDQVPGPDTIATPIVEPPVYASRPPVEAVPAESMVRNEKGGLKYSKHKPRPGLIPVLSWWETVKVATFGANKYTRDGIDGSNNWQLNDPAEYLDAVERHIAEFKMGRRADPESGFHPLAHAACDLFFVLWFELTGKGIKQ